MVRRTRITARLFSFFFFFLFLFCLILLPEPSPLQVDAHKIRICSLGVTLVQCSHFEELAPRKKFREKERDVSQVIPLVASRWRGSDTKCTSVKKRAGGSTAAPAVLPLAQFCTNLLELGAEIGSGKSSIRRNLVQIGPKEHQRKVGKGLKH